MIDITNLTSLITAFRNETEQGSISPETLGALLQAIANQLTSAATDQDQQKLSLLYDHIRTMGNCLTSVVQGSADRNNVLADYTFFNPITGIASAQRDIVLVRQATTERAGAMRAQQVIDLNDCKKNISNLQDVVDSIESSMQTNNTEYGSQFSILREAITGIRTAITELNDYVEQVDQHAQDNSDRYDDLRGLVGNLSSQVEYVPIHRGVIAIDSSSITSPVNNYFRYNMPDGHYDIVRGGALIGSAVSYQYGNFRVFDVVGLCHINSNTFVYQDTLAHILVRVAQNGLSVTNGTIDHVDLQNQINLKQDRLEAGNGISISGNKISVSSYPAPSYIIEFASSDGVFSGNFEPERYRELHHAIVEGKTIIVQNGVTFTTAVSTAIGEDYIVIRYSIPRIQQDNATVVLGVYELTVNERSYTSKSVFKVLPPA